MTGSAPPIGAPPEQEPAGVPPPLIRLQLEVDEPLLRLIRSMRSVVAQAPRAAAAAAAAAAEEDQLREPAKNKGRRALRKVAVRSLQLGPRQIARTDELDIVAKFLYKKPRKIVCQMRRGDALLKIDILWSNIKVMSACFDHATFDALTIEVKSPSEQYRADPPDPRRHLHWRRNEDLTVSTFCFQFDKGTLERSYGKMLYTDPSLMLRTPPPPPPPPAGDEEGSDESTATQQTVGMITAAAPVAPSFDAVVAETRDARHQDGRLHKHSRSQCCDAQVQRHPVERSESPGTYTSFVQMDVGYAQPLPIHNISSLHSLYT